MNRTVLTTILALCLSAARFSQACETLPLITPLPGTTVDQAQPTLTWQSPVPDALTRVQIQSYMPEGGVLKTFDVAVSGATYQPRTALTQSHAAVKVLLTQGCSQGHESLMAQPATFFIDTRQSCPQPTAAHQRRGSTGTVINWADISEAIHYEAVSISVSGTAQTPWTINRPRLELAGQDTPELVKIRTICKNAASHWVSIGIDDTLQ